MCVYRRQEFVVALLRVFLRVRQYMCGRSKQSSAVDHGSCDGDCADM